MEVFHKIIQFLIKDPIGLVLLSVISGVFANLVFVLLKVLWKRINKSYKHRKFVKYLTTMGVAHIYGQRTAKIMFGTTSQNVIWAADFVITIVKHISIILGELIILCMLLIILPIYLYWLPIVLISIVITIRYKKLKMVWKYFDMTEEMVFGKKYLEKEKEGYLRYWDRILKGKNKKEQQPKENDNQEE